MKEKNCVEVGFKNNAVYINSSFFREQINNRRTYGETLQKISQLPSEQRQELRVGLEQRARDALFPIGYEEHIIFSALRDLDK